MSGLSGTNDETIGTDNIEKVAGTTGLVGYANTYISLQAMNGIYINGIGSGNTANTELPFSNEADDNRYVSGVTNGNFWISGQNGRAVIKSCDRSTRGPNGEGIGSIHINSANGDVVVNVPNGNFESNVAANVTNNTTGNVTNNTTGNLKDTTHGHVTAIVDGNLHNRTGGTQENLNGGNLWNRVLGAQENVNLGDLTNFCLGAQENVNLVGLMNFVLGDILDFFIGAHQTVTLGFINEYHPIGKASEAESETKTIGTKIDNIEATLHSHKIDISETNCQIRSMLVHLNHAGIHLYD